MRKILRKLKNKEEMSEVEEKTNAKKVEELDLQQPTNLEKTKIRYLDMNVILKDLWLEGQKTNRTAMLSKARSSKYKEKDLSIWVSTCYGVVVEEEDKDDHLSHQGSIEVGV